MVDGIKYWVVIFLMICCPFILKSQGPFDILQTPDGHESQFYDVFPDSNFIYIIGDLLDTTIHSPGYPIRPWWCVLDYNGSLITKETLWKDSLSDQIGMYGSRLIKNINGNFIYAPIRYNESGFAECLILEIEPLSGEVLQYNIIGNPLDSTAYIIPRWVTIDPYNKGHILLAANMEFSGIQRSLIFAIDGHFNVTNSILIEDNGRDNYNCYMEPESDSTFIIIGESRKRNDNSDGPDHKPYFMRVDKKGKINTFNLANGIPDRTVGFFLSENMSIRRDVNGNWIFSALSYFPGWYSLPYVFSYDSEFNHMNWAINFSQDKTSTEQRHNLFGADYNVNNHAYVIVGQDNYLNDSYIFKTNDSGDSLWTRHYIPLNWEPEDVGFTGLLDVKATPYHSFVSVGKAVSFPDYFWNSWAILIDSFGCIIPGCQNIVSNEEVSFNNSELFSIYPNPATNFVGLLCTQNINSNVRISVFDLNGRIVEFNNISPTIGYQYLLNVADWTSGMYILRIDTIDGNLIQVSQILVQ